MKRLTKDERFTAYTILLCECEEWVYIPLGGFCDLIEKVFGIDTYDTYNFGYCVFKKLFPELYEKRTAKGYVFLFKNWGERISALKKCIKETY